MATYRYKALDIAGKVSEGELDGVDERELIAKLKAQNLSPLFVAEKKTEKAISTAGRKRQITKRDISHTTNQLASLLGAKLPLSRALQALENQAAGAEMKKLIADVSRMVQEGQPLSEALATYPQHFSGLYRSMVKAGEVGGVLELSLARVSEMLEKDEALKARLKGALTYPLIMLVVMMISIIVLITFVVPRFTGVFADMGAALPLPTKILLNISAVFQQAWWALAGVAALVYVAGKKYLRTEKGALALDRTKLNLPLAGELVRQISLARFAQTLGSLLGSGVPVLQAMDATRDVSGNRQFSLVMDELKRDVKEGKSLSQALAAHEPLFPSLVAGMVGTGEETGNLPDMLTNIGKYYAQEADVKIKTLTTLLEPVIILLMGLMVGFIIISMLLPIFQMTMMVK
jgi:type II secretion system protein F